MSFREFFHENRLWIGLIALLTFAVYAVSLRNGFVNWDDPQLLTENVLVQTFSPRIFTSYDPELYIPLTFLSFQLEHAVFGLDPFVFHLTNLLLHIGSVILLFWFFRQVLQNRWAAAILALIFAVHPLNTEAVAWVSARKDVLSTFFFLLSLNLYVRAQGRASRVLLWSLVAFFLALMAKVTVVVLPAILIAVDRWQGRRWSPRLVIEKWPYLLLSVIFGIVALAGKGQNLVELSTWQTILLACRSVAFLLGKFFVPLHLSVIYPQTGVISLSDSAFLTGLIVVLVLLAATWFLLRRGSDLLLGLTIFWLTLLPHFFNFSKAGEIYITSDRYMLLPSMGLLLILGVLVLQVRSESVQRIAAGMGCIAIIGFGALAFQRSLVWHDSGTLLINAVEQYPTSAVAYNNLGLDALQRGDLAAAEVGFREALKHRADYALPHNNLGLILMDRKEMVEALKEFTTAVTLDSEYAHAHLNIGVWYGRQGNLDEAEKRIQKAIELNPDLPQAYYNLAGVAMGRGKKEEAIALYQKTLRLQPKHKEALIQLGKLQNQ